MLTCPHQTSSSESGCLTTRLSLGERPVFVAGVGDQRAVLGDAGVLLVADGVLVERARREVAVDVADRQVVLFKTEAVHLVAPG